MKTWKALLIVLIIITLDQLTKQLALTHLTPYEPQFVLSILNWTLAFNTGAAFSFLNGAGGWQSWFFTIFSSLMSIALLIWIYKLPDNRVCLGLSLSFILGGALGNLIDRLHYGHVIDFIELHYQNYHWPVFNIADSAICIGAVLLIIVTLREN